jgi:hypothetical protein
VAASIVLGGLSTKISYRGLGGRWSDAMIGVPMRLVAARRHRFVAGVPATPGDAKPTPPAQNLSKKLNQSNGVIHPKEVDPAIEKPAPKTGDSNVVPPPGTSGGAPAPQPK